VTAESFSGETVTVGQTQRAMSNWTCQAVAAQPIEIAKREVTAWVTPDFAADQTWFVFTLDRPALVDILSPQTGFAICPSCTFAPGCIFDCSILGNSDIPVTPPSTAQFSSGWWPRVNRRRIWDCACGLSHEARACGGRAAAAFVVAAGLLTTVSSARGEPPASAGRPRWLFEPGARLNIDFPWGTHVHSAIRRWEPAAACRADAKGMRSLARLARGRPGH
jgi:hypothetical protein